MESSEAGSNIASMGRLKRRAILKASGRLSSRAANRGGSRWLTHLAQGSNTSHKTRYRRTPAITNHGFRLNMFQTIEAIIDIGFTGFLLLAAIGSCQLV